MRITQMLREHPIARKYAAIGATAGPVIVGGVMYGAMKYLGLNDAGLYSALAAAELGVPFGGMLGYATGRIVEEKEKLENRLGDTNDMQ